MNYLRILPLALLLVWGCKPHTVDPTDTPEEVTGEATAIGKPIGNAVTKTIGPAGGLLTTPDGRLTFTIPAGALAQETPITIQPVENTAFGGTGLGYELAPKGLQLAKESVLAWHYTPADIDGSAPEAVGIAYQDENGIWQGSDKVDVNTAQEKVSAPVSKLAHWSFYKQFDLEYTETSKRSPLAPADNAQLVVKYQQGYDSDELLVPLTPVKVLAASRVVRWTLNGQTNNPSTDGNYAANGQITPHLSQAQASYDAPPREPDVNPVAIGVELDLKQHGHLILVKHIQVENASYLKIGGLHDTNPNVALTVQGKRLSIVITDKTGLQGFFSCIIENFTGKGTYQASHPNDLSIPMNVYLTGDGGYASGYYPPQGGPWISGMGQVTITEYNGPTKPIAATISGTFYKTPQVSVGVSGKFRGLAAVVPGG